MNCILCAPRNIETQCDGHVCDPCRRHIDRDLAAILAGVNAAAEHVQPGRGSSGERTGVFESKPPIVPDAVDPELADVAVFDGQQQRGTLLELLESWERMIREERGFAAYGDASVLRVRVRVAKIVPAAKPPIGPWIDGAEPASIAGRGHRRDVPSISQSRATLVGVVGFLRSQLDWACQEPTFPIEDFAAELRSAVSVVQRWSTDARDRGTIVLCPTLLADGRTCGQRLRVSILTEIEGRDDHRATVWCKGCGAVRKPDQLLAASAAEDAYLPAAMIAEHLGIAEGTIRTWAATGRVQRDGRRYRFGDVRALVIDRMTRSAAGS